MVLICNFFTKSALHYGLSGFWGLYAMMYMLLYMEICTGEGLWYSVENVGVGEVVGY